MSKLIISGYVTYTLTVNYAAPVRNALAWLRCQVFHYTRFSSLRTWQAE